METLGGQLPQVQSRLFESDLKALRVMDHTGKRSDFFGNWGRQDQIPSMTSS